MKGLSLCFQMRGFPKKEWEVSRGKIILSKNKRNVVEGMKKLFLEKRECYGGNGEIFFGKRLML